jgi:hypothetical protein
VRDKVALEQATEFSVRFKDLTPVVVIVVSEKERKKERIKGERMTEARLQEHKKLSKTHATSKRIELLGVDGSNEYVQKRVSPGVRSLRSGGLPVRVAGPVGHRLH